MSQSWIPQSSDCCATCTSTSSTSIKGDTGATGATGPAGADGVNAYTTTTAPFTMPVALLLVVNVAVVNSDWMAIGQVVYVQGAGYFTVNAKSDSTHVSLANLGYTGNAPAGSIIASSSQISPAGLKGTDGADGSSGSGITYLAYTGPPLYTPTTDAALAVDQDRRIWVWANGAWS